MSTSTVAEVSSTIRAEMARRDLSQGDIAERLGLSRTGVSRRLSGQLSWSLDELATIAELFKMPVRDLLPDEPADRAFAS